MRLGGSQGQERLSEDNLHSRPPSTLSNVQCAAMCNVHASKDDAMYS